MQNAKQWRDVLETSGVVLVPLLWSECLHLTKLYFHSDKPIGSGPTQGNIAQREKGIE